MRKPVFLSSLLQFVRLLSFIVAIVATFAITTTTTIIIMVSSPRVAVDRRTEASRKEKPCHTFQRSCCCCCAHWRVTLLLLLLLLLTAAVLMIIICFYRLVRWLLCRKVSKKRTNQNKQTEKNSKTKLSLLRELNSLFWRKKSLAVIEKSAGKCDTLVRSFLKLNDCVCNWCLAGVCARCVIMAIDIIK